MRESLEKIKRSVSNSKRNQFQAEQVMFKPKSNYYKKNTRWLDSIKNDVVEINQKVQEIKILENQFEDEMFSYES